MENEVILTTGQLITMMVGLWIGGLLVGIGFGAKLNNKDDTREKK
jgi:hypothetical protein